MHYLRIVLLLLAGIGSACRFTRRRVDSGGPAAGFAPGWRAAWRKRRPLRCRGTLVDSSSDAVFHVSTATEIDSTPREINTRIVGAVATQLVAGRTEYTPGRR
jgi:hypothetical protein